MEIKDLPYPFCKPECPLMNLKIETTDIIGAGMEKPIKKHELQCWNYPDCQIFLKMMTEK